VGSEHKVADSSLNGDRIFRAYCPSPKGAIRYVDLAGSVSPVTFEIQPLRSIAYRYYSVHVEK
jgi:hypothetical protein